MLAKLWLFLCGCLACAALSAREADHESRLRLNLDYSLDEALTSGNLPAHTTLGGPALQLQMGEFSEVFVPTLSQADPPVEPTSQTADETGAPDLILAFIRAVLAFSLFALCVRMSRQLLAALRHMTGAYSGTVALPVASWPAITVIVPARAASAADTACLRPDLPERLAQLLAARYPHQQLHIIVYGLQGTSPAWLTHYGASIPGGILTAASVQAALDAAQGEVVIFLDEIPEGQNWLERYASAFFDASIGAVHSTGRQTATSAGLASLAELARAADASRPRHILDPLLLAGARIVAVRRTALSTIRDWQHGADIDMACQLAEQGWRLGKLDVRFAEDSMQTLDWNAHFAAVASCGKASAAAALRQLRAVLGRMRSRAETQRRLQLLNSLLSPLLWVSAFILSLVLYLFGDTLWAGMGLVLCGLTAFDMRGRPTSFMHAALALRSASLGPHVDSLRFAVPAFVMSSFIALLTAAGQLCWRERRIAPSKMAFELQ